MLLFCSAVALGIVVESPQRRHGARTCNVKPDPCGNAQNIKLIAKIFVKFKYYLDICLNT